MASLTNTPFRNSTLLALEARKSFSLTLMLHEPDEAPVDLTGCSIEFVMKSREDMLAGSNDDANLIENSTAEIDDPTTGYARFDIQASDLDHDYGEYPFAIVLLMPAGYSVVLVKGTVDLLPNTEFAAIDGVYVDSGASAGLEVTLRDTSVVDIQVGSVLPPGFYYLSAQEKTNISELVTKVLMEDDFGTAAYKNISYFALAAAGVPDGGLAGRVLAKRTGSSYDTYWANIQSILPGGPLDATGVTAGMAPLALGDGNWEWAFPTVDLDSISETATNAVMTQLERTKLDGIEDGAQVNVDPAWVDIIGKPAFGSASLEDTTAFAAAVHTHDTDDFTDLKVSETEPDPSVYKVWIKKPVE